MSPAWFLLILLLLDLGATFAFAGQRDWPCVLIYGGAALIQAGSLWLIR